MRTNPELIGLSRKEVQGYYFRRAKCSKFLKALWRLSKPAFEWDFTENN